MERKIVLEIEELEERIAPHCGSAVALGGGNAAVGINPHGGDLCLPNGNAVDLPDASDGGMARAMQGGN